jgi:hypothetical protein
MARSEAREEVERDWFRRVAMIIMVAAICMGGFPVLKDTLFPVVRTR